MTNAIKVERLTKAFGDKTALNDISFHLKQGEIFGFLGPSGSGKTTTVKILTSQLLHTAGDVEVFGVNLAKANRPQYLKRIGILTDNSGLYERLSIYDNLELFCKLYDVPLKRIGEVLDEVNLGNEQRTPVKQLSKGMKQRVTLARAILHKPDLLFLDEPTSALDPVNAQHIRKTLTRLNQEGTTIFLTTHNMEEAEQLCDRIAFINNGVITAMDTPQNLRLAYADPTITVKTSEGSFIVHKDDNGAKQIQALITQGKLLAIHSNEPTLGDIFVQLTGRELQ
ncbi:ABC transporter ATP-binding protein [Paenibacillus contaminans]|uniref:ABC transporter ATP-binding protein n=1 Tax=Paenibacillus contaminans TaxID=450362 RepID=A0A329LS82_9BACL|nr:ABC transporter ATP-binding protein [Paenibacillus contaminans]RAV10791.1 ABC transporter ATP-binding protein [Paenibacillus contaminans]